MSRAVSLFLSTFFLSVFAVAQNPVPYLNQPLVPAVATPGGAGFTLTLNGTGFVSGAVANWNESQLATTFVSSSQLTASVPASDIAVATTVAVTVTNPSPGDGTSNPQYFAVANPVASPTFTESTATVNLPGCTGSTFAADFNDDGKLDLAYSCFLPPNAPVLATALGNGDGTFQAPVSLNTQFEVVRAVTGDFIGDGKLDLAAVENQNSDVGEGELFLGNGDGTFQAPSGVNIGNTTVQLIAGDFNKDGKLDLAAANSLLNGAISAGLSVLLGNGNGSFQNASSHDTSVPVASLATGDFDGAGNLDIVYIAFLSPGSQLRFLHGNGDGTFQPPTSVPSADLNQLVAADINGDGKLDLVGILQGSANSGVSVFLGNGNGTFQAPVVYGTIPNPASLVVRDINADGKLDIAVLSQNFNSLSPGTIYTFLGNGDGTFQNTTTISFPNAVFSFAAGDFNGDGRVDFAGEVESNSQSTSSIFTLLQSPGSFSVSASPPSASVTPGQTANYTITVSPSGGFAQVVTLSCSGAPANSTCSVSPGSVTLNGSGSATANVSVVTSPAATASTAIKNWPVGNLVGLWLALPGVLGLLMFPDAGRGCLRRNRRHLWYVLALLGIVLILVTIPACGGGNSGASGTPAGTYHLTVTGTYGSGAATVTKTTQVTLVVQ